MAVALRSCHQGTRTFQSGAVHAQRRVCRLVTRATETNQNAPSPTTAPETSSTSGAVGKSPSGPTSRREFNSWGARIVETDERLTGPEDDKDFWEGEQMEFLGRVMERYFFPVIIVLGLLAGAIAVRTYNDGADVYLAPAPGPEEDVVVIPAGALAPTPVVEAPPPASSSSPQ